MNVSKKITALCVSLFTVFTLNASPLKCNFTSADISTTQKEHVMLAGFAARTELSNGIHLKLRTSCLSSFRAAGNPDTNIPESNQPVTNRNEQLRFVKRSAQSQTNNSKLQHVPYRRLTNESYVEYLLK